MHRKRLKSELVYEGSVFQVRIDQLEDHTGRTHQVDVVEHAGAVAIIALNEKKQIWLVEQYRHAAQKSLFELPAGTLEQGEAPQDCAIRECQEEIGMLPGKLQPLGGFFLAPGYSSEYLHLFLAQELSPAKLPRDADEDIQAKSYTPEALRTMMEAGDIQDAKTIAGLFLAGIEL
jgi:ADP-ribose pyrophosphatase